MSLLQEASQGKFTRRKVLELGGKAGLGLVLTGFGPQNPESLTQKTSKEYTAATSKWIVSDSYTSDYTRSEEYRENNIIIGSNALNNWFWDFDENLTKYGKNLIEPGETFSISSVLGQVDNFEDGFAIGPNLKRMPIYGGGICQIPTTMFVASLKAGLYVEERRNHSYYNGWYFGDPNDTKEFGMDATVLIPGIDLVVRNTYDYPIRFFFKIDDEHLRVDVLGPPELEPYHSEIDGPYFLRTGEPVKNKGKFPWATSTIVTQRVWRDDSKKEPPLFEKSFQSYYRTSPYG